jgi:hypothetical protein
MAFSAGLGGLRTCAARRYGAAKQSTGKPDSLASVPKHPAAPMMRTSEKHFYIDLIEEIGYMLHPCRAPTFAPLNTA